MWRQASKLATMASASRNMFPTCASNYETQLRQTVCIFPSLRLFSVQPPGPGVGRLNHIAIAVPSVAEASKTYSKVLGANVSAPQDLSEHGVRVVFVSLANTKLELLEPLGEASPIANYLKKNPAGGMHHMCLEVPDIHGAVEHVASTGTRLLNDKPKIGAHGTPVVFLHPKDMAGVLTELEEVKPS